MLKNQLITPEGTKDYLFEEAAARRLVEQELCGLFQSRGFSEVTTPGLEFLDVFSVHGRGIPIECMQKLVDPKGRLMVLRPDSTLPIARLCATRLKGREKPVRLFYSQPVYSVTRDVSGRSDEVTQAGVELIGPSSRKSDLEILTMAAQAMQRCGMENYRLELGHIGVFNALMDDWQLDEDDREELRLLIESKNYPGLNDWLDSASPSPQAGLLKQLPRLFGGAEVFAQAGQLFSGGAATAIAYLREIYESLCSLGLGEKITIDLGLVNRTDYYTGVVFKGYIEGHGGEVLSGGRYDRLLAQFGEDAGAIGFAVDVDVVANALPDDKKRNQPPELLIYTAPGAELTGIREMNHLSEQGVQAEFSLAETVDEAREYAASRRIARLRIIEDGKTAREIPVE